MLLCQTLEKYVFGTQTKLALQKVYDTNIFMTPQELIKLAGGPSKVARAIERSHTAVILWKKIPAHHVLTLESHFGIPREQLRPDLYTPRPKTAPEQKGAA